MAVTQRKQHLYEMLYIIDPTREESDIQRVENMVKESISGMDGEIKKYSNWGRRTLAYEIKKKREGIYINLEFMAPPEAPYEIAQLVKTTEPILRHLVFRVPKAKLIQEERDKEKLKREAERAERERERELKEQAERQAAAEAAGETEVAATEAAPEAPVSGEAPVQPVGDSSAQPAAESAPASGSEPAQPAEAPKTETPEAPAAEEPEPKAEDAPKAEETPAPESPESPGETPKS